MFNAHGKKSLYEAMRESQAKALQGKSLQPLHPESAPAAPPAAQPDVQPVSTPLPAEPAPVPQRTVIRWPTKPRMFQVNGGRIELSLPYQLLIAGLLCGIVILLIAFRIGQHSPIEKSARPAQPAVEKPKATPKAAVNVAPKATSQPTKAAIVTAPAEPAQKAVSASKGTNRIVIQTHQNRNDLEPVKNFFAANGIDTEIRKIGTWYYLITTEKYNNPEKPGTDGFEAKQRIIELGAKYQPPAGYGSFGAKPFSDAYGMRLDD